jgi:Asp-tRNA(Asn)/Glu-tRNA(Gln) amidotransferase A subunit family amidase
MAGEPVSFLEATIVDVQSRMRRGEITCEQLVQWYLDRIKRYDRQGPDLRAIVNVNQQAIARARELDQQLKANGKLSGPLHGVPVLVKDQAETSFVPTTFGTRAYAEYQPATDAFLVRKLNEAGAVILAKASMCDFAAGWFSFSSVTERTRNPYATDRDAGGSSAGTGAGIAANFGLVGVGEDTGGSIRIPASFNNLYGLRVTTGLISRTGFSPLVHFQDTPGPMARTVRDLAKLLDVLVGYDPQDPYTAVAALAREAGSYEASLDNAKLHPIRIGVLKQGFDGQDESSAEVNSVVRAMLKRIGQAGVQFVDVEVPDLQDWIVRTSLYIQQSKFDLNRFMGSRPEKARHTFEEIYTNKWFHPLNDLFHNVHEGPDDPTSTAEYYPQRLAQQEFQRVLLNLYAKDRLDFLAFPNVKVLPPTYKDLESQKWTCLTFPTNTVIAAQSHLPALSMPAGFAAGQLPVGVEIVGKPYEEAALLRFAYACEQMNWMRKAPELDTKH